LDLDSRVQRDIKDTAGAHSSTGPVEMLCNCKWIIQPIYSGCGCCPSARLPALQPCISMAGLVGEMELWFALSLVLARVGGRADYTAAVSSQL